MRGFADGVLIVFMRDISQSTVDKCMWSSSRGIPDERMRAPPTAFCVPVDNEHVNRFIAREFSQWMGGKGCAVRGSVHTDGFFDDVARRAKVFYKGIKFRSTDEALVLKQRWIKDLEEIQWDETQVKKMEELRFKIHAAAMYAWEKTKGSTQEKKKELEKDDAARGEFINAMKKRLKREEVEIDDSLSRKVSSAKNNQREGQGAANTVGYVPGRYNEDAVENLLAARNGVRNGGANNMQHVRRTLHATPSADSMNRPRF
jgi:hypothetical protein